MLNLEVDELQQYKTTSGSIPVSSEQESEATSWTQDQQNWTVED